MHIFKEGRQALLEFLRNLTPQILILSLALISGNGLTMKCCDPDNTKQTLIMFAFLAIWAAAVWANSSIFVEKYLVSAKNVGRAYRLLMKFKLKGLKLLWAVILFSKKNNKIILIEAIVVFVVLEFGFVSVIFSAISSATSIMRLFGK